MSPLILSYKEKERTAFFSKAVTSIVQWLALGNSHLHEWVEDHQEAGQALQNDFCRAAGVGQGAAVFV